MSHTRSSDSVRSHAASAYTGSSARTCSGRHQCHQNSMDNLWNAKHWSGTCVLVSAEEARFEAVCGRIKL
jgi:hypothetical protein